MRDFIQTPTAQWVLLAAGLAAMIACGVYLIAKAREMLGRQGPATSEIISEFRDLHREGQLSDEEFKTIKLKLADRLQAEIRAADGDD